MAAPSEIAAPQKSVSSPFNANAVVQAYAQPFGMPTTYRGQTGQPSEFPVQLYAPDQRDKYYKVMPKVLSDLKDKGVPNVNYAAGPADVQYYADKVDAQANGEFKSFMVQQMKLDTPESAAYWKTTCPEIFQERLNIVASQHDLSKKLASINIVGPQSTEDWAVIWGIQSGRIQAPPEGALYRPETYATWNKIKKSGMFNTFLWGTKDSEDQYIQGGDYTYHAPVGSSARRAGRWGPWSRGGLGQLPQV